MKLFQRLWMAFHVWIYRRSGGKTMGSLNGAPLLLLTVKGRKTGKLHTVPLGCFDHKDGYVIVASNQGLPTDPAWYRNLQSNPRATVQLLDKVMQVTAETLAGAARRQAWQQVITTSPNYAGYEKRTSREIPLLLLRPVK
jgi:deazaflavin-dependent oxidoreductase (nitroreductase family)